MPATVTQLLQVAQRHQLQVLAIRARTEVALTAAWRRIVNDPTEQTADRWSAAAVPVLQAAELAAAAAGLAYVALYVQAAGATAEPSELAAADFSEPRGVPLLELLHRPIITLRTALSEGHQLTDALVAGQQRMAQIATTDPMLSYRAATSAAMVEQPAIQGYRRVPDGKACKFCLLAATQRYRDSDLMPLHPACGCTVAPIIGAKDPGQIIDRESLRRLKDEHVVDEISYRRRVAEGQRVAHEYRSKAAHWREQARTTTDQEAETRYAKRADAWLAKASEREAQIEHDRARLRAFREGRLTDLTAVHQHGELGPTLYEPGHHFDAA